MNAGKLQERLNKTDKEFQRTFKEINELDEEEQECIKRVYKLESPITTRFSLDEEGRYLQSNLNPSNKVCISEDICELIKETE